MAIKAGRVGVNPADVDPVNGHISPESVDSYTKAQADAKFETQTHAASTYETKSDAAALQPKTLAVPISMLQGSLLVPKTTVEDVIQTMDRAMSTKELTDKMAVTTGTITPKQGYSINPNSVVKKSGNIVVLSLMLVGLTADANAWVQVAEVSNNCLPDEAFQGFYYATGGVFGQIQITTGGVIQLYPHSAVNNSNVFANLVWCSKSD